MNIYALVLKDDSEQQLEDLLDTMQKNFNQAADQKSGDAISTIRMSSLEISLTCKQNPIYQALSEKFKALSDLANDELLKPSYM